MAGWHIRSLCIAKKSDGKNKKLRECFSSFLSRWHAINKIFSKGHATTLALWYDAMLISWHFCTNPYVILYYEDIAHSVHRNAALRGFECPYSPRSNVASVHAGMESKGCVHVDWVMPEQRKNCSSTISAGRLPSWIAKPPPDPYPAVPNNS